MNDPRRIRPLKSLQRSARNRKPGYLDACLELGRLDVETGLVHFEPEAWAKLREKFKRGLGDAVHSVAGPIGSAIGWPCMSGNGTELKIGSPCADAKAVLDKIKLPSLSP